MESVREIIRSPNIRRPRLFFSTDSNYQDYAGSCFREKRELNPPSLGGDACVSSPAGHGRARRGHLVPHECVEQAPVAVVDTHLLLPSQVDNAGGAGGLL